MKAHLLICLSLGILSQLAYADGSCESWFLKSKLKPGTESCEIDCATLPFDIGNFDCSSQCESFCQTYIKPDTVADLAKIIEDRVLTPEEKSLSAKYPKEALLVYRAKRTAEKVTERIFGRGRRNDESDAFRHFMWSGQSSKDIGVAKAKAFLEAHESTSEQEPNEKQMDLANNTSGIAAGERLKNESNFQEKLEKEALRLLKEKKLQVIKPRGEVPEWAAY
jgi:hypothetical protein